MKTLTRQLLKGALVALVVFGLCFTGCPDGGDDPPPRNVELTVEINPGRVTVPVDGTITLSATVQPYDAANKTVVWSVFNGADCISIDKDGNIKGLKAGTGCAVQATAKNGEYARAAVTVVDKSNWVAVTGFTLDKASFTLNKSRTAAIAAAVTPEAATEKGVRWSSNNPAVATVSRGTVTAVAEGTAVITAATVFGGFTQTSTVTVVGPDEKVLSWIEIKTMPDKVGFELGVDDFSIEGLEVEAVYSDGTKESVANSALTVNNGGFNKSTEGAYNVTLSWNRCSVVYKVIVGRIPSSMQIIKRGNNIYFVTYQSVSLAGIEIKATYSDGSEETLTADSGLTASVSPAMTVPGPKTLTVKYLDVSAGTYTVFAFPSENMRAFAQGIYDSDSGKSAEDRLDVKVPANLTTDDFLAQYPQDGNPLNDPMGGLFIAIGNGNKYINLDMTEYTGELPGTVDNSAFNYRNARWVPRIGELKLPPDITLIGDSSFRNCGLAKVNLNGLSKLEKIGEAAFRSNGGLRELDFTGCVKLASISDFAFDSISAEMVDLSPCIALESIGRDNFGSNNLKYLEFPASLTSITDYGMSMMGNLEYVRFRGDRIRVRVGFPNFCYFSLFGKSMGGMPDVHKWHDVNAPGNAGMKSYTMFHPDTLGYTTQVGGLSYYWNMDGRDQMPSHQIPLPAEADNIKGKALLDWTAEPYRGRASVNVKVTGLAAFAGKTAEVNVAAVTGSKTFTAAGDLDITIGTPVAGELQELNPTTAQAITGYYGATSRYLNPGFKFWEGYNADATWQVGLAGVGVTHTGKLGIPVVWPDSISPLQRPDYPAGFPSGEGFPRFTMLEIKVKDGATEAGRLERWGNAQYTDGGNVYEEVKVVRYVYVDKDALIFRADGGPLQCVWLKLKKGWNLIEGIDTFTWTLANDNNGSPTGEVRQIYLAVWISNGKMPDMSDGRGSTVPGALKDKEVPWVKRTDDPYRDITSQPLKAGEAWNAEEVRDRLATWRMP